jgi:hypothetical protein
LTFSHPAPVVQARQQVQEAIRRAEEAERELARLRALLDQQGR